MTSTTHTIMAQLVVLDFERRVHELGIHGLQRQYDEILDLVVTKAADRTIVVPVPADPAGGLALIGGSRRLDSASFSDTILLWTKYEVPVAESFLDRVVEFCCEAFKRGLPVCGSVSFGDAAMDAEAMRYSGVPLQECRDAIAKEPWVGVHIGESVRGHWIGDLRNVRPRTMSGLINDSHILGADLALDWPRKWRSDFEATCGTWENLVAAWRTEAWFAAHADVVTSFCRSSEQDPRWWEGADWGKMTFAGHVCERPYG